MCQEGIAVKAPGRPQSARTSLSRLCFLGTCAGIPIDQVARLSQAERDAVGRKIFQTTLLELFRFRFMQVRTARPRAAPHTTPFVCTPLLCTAPLFLFLTAFPCLLFLVVSHSTSPCFWTAPPSSHHTRIAPPPLSATTEVALNLR